MEVYLEKNVKWVAAFEKKHYNVESNAALAAAEGLKGQQENM